MVGQSYDPQEPHSPVPARRASLASRRKRAAKRTFGGTVSTLGVALAHQRGVDHRAAGVDVGQQAAVAVALLDVELEPDLAAADEPLVEIVRAVGVALDGRARLGRLRRVDADVAHALDASGAQPHADRVAVGDGDDAAAEPALRPAVARLLAAGRDRDGRQRGRRRRASRQTRASDSASS